MKRMNRLLFVALVIIFLEPVAAWADELDQGRQLMVAGNLEGAAEFFNNYALSHPDDATNTPEALALTGRILDVLSDPLTGQAEKSCYWGKGGSRSPDCMERFVAKFNTRFGDGAFRYEHAVLSILYTGVHYRVLLDRFSSSKYASEADFYPLLHDLVGHPDVVLPKIKAFLSRHSKGEWNRKGLLLWARANQDVWYIHRNWSWVIYGGQLSPEDQIIKSEPYRQEALKAYQKLVKDQGTWEASIAKREYPLIQNNQDDGVIYTIVNDSMPGTLATWGMSQIAAPVSPSDPGAGFGNKKKSKNEPPSEAVLPPVFEPAAPLPEGTEKAKKVPSRWN